MSKEGQPNLPFSDTQIVYRQAVVDLIRNKGLIEEDGVEYINTGSRADRAKIPTALPMDGKVKIPHSLRTHNMAQVYLFGNETHEEIGDYFGVIRQAAYSAVRQATIKVLEAAPQVFDFGSLSLRKPLSGAKKERTYGRGVSGDIRRAAENGATYEDLIKQGFNPSQISSARYVLSRRERQISIPPSPHRNWEEIVRLLEDSYTDRLVVRELILEIPIHTYYKYSKDLSTRPAVFMDIYRIARKAGLYPRINKADVSFVADYLASKCIPVGRAERKIKNGKQKGNIQRYCFTTVNFVDETVGALQSAHGERFDAMRKEPSYWRPDKS